uniref:Uncharacterized protein, isoform B n=1 Tax=Drosophila pseudoobscura pseudoobscura TaxID=46245 RepID=A0A0R3NX42_DROPS
MGALKFQFGDAGKRNGQFFYPRKGAVFQHNGNFVVCDRGNGRSRMQIISKCGTYMFKISIRFMDIVTGLAVTAKGHIVAVDSVSPTVFVISEEGMLVHWFDCSVFVRGLGVIGSSVGLSRAISESPTSEVPRFHRLASS